MPFVIIQLAVRRAPVVFVPMYGNSRILISSRSGGDPSEINGRAFVCGKLLKRAAAFAALLLGSVQLVFRVQKQVFARVISGRGKETASWASFSK